MKRNIKRMTTICALSAAFALVATPAALAQEEGDVANSFRYSNGQQTQSVEQDSPRATMGASLCSLSSTSALGALAQTSSSATAYTTLANKVAWAPSYGTSYFYNGSTKVKVKGAKAAVIDVSVWNGKIKWKKVKAAGVKYAIIRCGYGQDEESQDDKQWARNVKYAKKQGIKLGVYLYSYAYTEDMAAGEAEHTLRCLSDAGLKPADLALPVYYDLEEGGGSPKVGSHSISNLTLARMTTTWCNAVAAKGYNVGVYANTNWWSNYLTNGVFSSSKWSKWVAQYNSLCQMAVTSAGKQDSIANYGRYLDLWQFTSTGNCDGNNAAGGNIDVNWLFNKSFNSANTKVKMPGANITYKLNGGKNNSKNPSEVNGTSLTVKLKKPTRTGYTFEGWYTSKTFESDTKVSKITVLGSETIMLYAKWSKTKYSIVYNIDGEVMDGDGYTGTYTIKTATFSLPVPKKDGYGFAGWYAKKACTGAIKSQVAKGSTGNLSLYGTWVKGASNVKVTAKSLTVYKKAKTSAKAVATLSKKNVACITKTKTVSKKNWGYVYNTGWIELSNTKAV